MLKKIVLSTVAFIAGTYMILALTCFTKRPADTPCQGIDVSIIGDKYEMLDNEKISSLLEAKGLNPKGKPMNKIDCNKIEEAIKGSSLIKDCQCYKTHRNLIGIRISSRTPIMQVFDKNGKEFYIDDSGNIINGVPTAVYLPLASGNIDTDMAKNELLEIATYLQENRFWKEQTEQIYFTPKKEIILIPRVGNHTIELGSCENLSNKLETLEKFYKKGLNKVGWNKYEKLNIEFNNQVIGTKR